MTTSNKSTSSSIGTLALALCGLPVMVGLLAVWRGFVLTYLWSWFVVGYFHVPPLSIPIAIGLSLIAGFFSTHQKNDETLGNTLAMAVFAPAMTLFIGWIVTKFM